MKNPISNKIDNKFSANFLVILLLFFAVTKLLVMLKINFCKSQNFLLY